MEKLLHLCGADLDRVIKSNKDLILFFYKENDPTSILGRNTMNEVFALIGRPFDMYLIHADSEPEILNAFSVENVPEYISVKNRKIFKRSTDLLEVSEVLALLK